MRPLGTLLVLVVLGLAAAPALAGAEGPVALVVNADDPAFSWERVQPAMAEAVGAPMVATDDVRARERRGLLTVTWRPSRRELAVTYEDTRGTFSRVVPAPADAAAALSTAAALAANLARDQAAEVLGDAAPPPRAPPPPAPSPEPSAPVARDTGYTPLPLPPSPPLPRWIVSLSVGTGAGTVRGLSDTGSGSATAGIAPSQLGQIVPEVGLRVLPSLVLSLAARYQVITSTTDLKLPMAPEFMGDCGGNYVCETPRGAFAMFAKATFADWRPGRGLRPYGSVSLGAGEVRMAVAFPSRRSCAPTGMSTCVDTVTNGPVFVGAGAGLRLPLAGAFALVAGLEVFAGVPDPSLNVDLNVGASAAF
jgi:hypothetical protein